MNKELLEKREKIAVVGMGYVGFPLAVAFAEKGINVIGFDLNSENFEIIKKIRGLKDTIEEIKGQCK